LPDDEDFSWLRAFGGNLNPTGVCGRYSGHGQTSSSSSSRRGRGLEEGGAARRPAMTCWLIWKYFSSFSHPSARRPASAAALKIVPEPVVKSTTRSPGRKDRRIK